MPPYMTVKKPRCLLSSLYGYWPHVELRTTGRLAARLIQGVP
jgi:hypothetical protein